jgi:putative flippase GtrA
MAMDTEKQVLVWRFWMTSKYYGPSKSKISRQFFSYVIIGLLTNFLGFALYLFLTYLWSSPKVTMTLLYSVGALIGFFANRRFTFSHDSRIGVAGMRYVFAQLLGYLLNLSLLLLFVDLLGFAHQLVQAVAIVVVAIFLFVLLRFFVFAHQPPDNVEVRL